jgi:hypothetical protein
VDDFESYTDDEGSRIYESWVDGWTNGTGSVVGYLQAPFAETTIIHGGKQAMPFEYNNVKTPFYSETERTLDTTQDWTTNGADTLALYFRGYPVGFADKGNNAFTVSGGGTDIWGTSDQFRFVYKQLNGNGSITMKVDSIANTDVWAKASVMIRETLDATAKNAAIAVTPGSGVSFQWRNALAGSSSNTNAGTTGMVAPYWVRITRTGNVFKAERSPDGKTWTQQGVDTTVQMAANVYIGMAVTSHNANATTTAEISNVSTTGTVTGQWQAPAIGAAQRANSPAPLYLVVEDKAGKKATAVNANPTATTVAAWTEWRISLSDLAGVNLAAVKKITLGVGDQATRPRAAAGCSTSTTSASGTRSSARSILPVVPGSAPAPWHETGVLQARDSGARPASRTPAPDDTKAGRWSQTTPRSFTVWTPCHAMTVGFFASPVNARWQPQGRRPGDGGYRCVKPSPSCA